MKIDHEPAFNWWVPHVLKKRDRIISLIRKRIPRYLKRNHKLVFDVKMEDFRQKARLVSGGHMTEAPPTITYASVVSRETVRLALTIASLNDL